MIKVFFVDDEIVIREGVRNAAFWNEGRFCLVGEAQDGEMALPMIRDAKPDIVITDIRMPFMDGMQLSAELQKTMPWVSVIVFSGYDDFAYAKQAIQYGVKDYLVKPISADELKQALEKAAAQMEETRRAREDVEKLRARLSQSNLFVREKLLSLLFMEPLSEAAAKDMLLQMRGIGINLSAGRYAVIDFAFEEARKETKKALDALYDLAGNSGGAVQVYACSHGARALLMGDDETDTEERVYSFAASALQALALAGAPYALSAVGDTVAQFQDVYQSMRTARHIRHMMMHQEGGFHGFLVADGSELGVNGRPMTELDLHPLYERLQYTKPQELPAVFEEYVRSLGASDLHSTVAADYLYVEARVTACRMVKEAGKDPCEALNMAEYDRQLPDKDLQAAAALKLLEQALLCRQACAEMGGERTEIAQARKYLSEHFQDSNLMLKDVADAVAMSCSRFSTVFAQETGTTFTEYLTALRISKAKELLRATDRRSSQIAYEIGYSDPHYFSYTFKKMTGSTPGEYRKNHS